MHAETRRHPLTFCCRCLLTAALLLLLVLSARPATAGIEAAPLPKGKPPAAATPTRLVFASYAVGVSQAQKAVVLLRSIRSFGGAYRGSPVYVAADASASAVLGREHDAALKVLPLDVPANARRVPLAAKAYAAAQIERGVVQSADTMLWIDPETVVLGRPEGLVLAAREAVALQPVFLSNRVGLPAGQAPDPYWARIYREAGIAATAVPTVETGVDGVRIRFYINCGVIALRPSRGLAVEWARVLSALLDDTAYRAVALADPLRALFLHQAALSGVLAARTRPSERRWFPIRTAYPIGLHDRVPAARRAARLEEVVCLIYDQAWDQDPRWLSKVPVDGQLRAWLRAESLNTLQVTSRIYREEGQCNTYLVGVGDGWVVVDPGGASGPDSILRDRAGSEKLQAILLTHAHPDHRAGIAQWKQGRDVPVVAERRHADLLADQDAIAGLLAIRNATLGQAPQSAADSGRAVPPRTPVEATRFIDRREALAFGDRHFEIIPVGGETPDTSLIWVPEERALMVADDFYSEFPNISTPRGAKARPALEYVRAMDTALSLEPEVLLPGHGEPIVGAAAVAKALTRYRDAVRLVHEAVLRGLNAGKDVQALMVEIRLPEELRLDEGYGRVAWAVRGIYEYYAGWFDGRTVSLFAEPRAELQGELATLAGGPDRLAARATELVRDGKPLLALHLTDIALAAAPSHAASRKARVSALEVLQGQATNFFERAWIARDILGSR